MMLVAIALRHPGVGGGVGVPTRFMCHYAFHNGSIRDLPLFNHFGNSLTVRLLVRLLRLEYLLT